MKAKKMDSSGIALKVEHVSKSFRLPTEKANGLKQAFINRMRGVKGFTEQHVLKDISFEIKKGDFFGIVGRNGSGKSTLLKLISQIYSPDAGKITVHGSLVPFIELGVGFNPELTGRENIYLNGALLGFSRSEIDGMYEDIVDFAELHDFMDQKLKNYSSGMQVRLAFSVAIKAQGDILVLDEVLAVGDEAFQRKCNQYFEKLKGAKKTVILVTHDMGAVKRFCTRAILIEDGHIKAAGIPDDIANQYTLDNLVVDESKNQSMDKMSVSDSITSIRIVPRTKRVLSYTDTLKFDVEYEHLNTKSETYVGISLLYNGSVSIIEHNTLDIKPVSDDGKRVTYSYTLPLERFTQGEFAVSAAVFEKKTKELLAFTTDEGNFHFSIINQGPMYGGMLRQKGSWV